MKARDPKKREQRQKKEKERRETLDALPLRELCEYEN